MSRTIRLLGMTLVAVLAFSGVASAHSFVAEKAGAVTRVKNTTQVFKTGSGPAVECTADAVSNANAVAGKQLTLAADVSYSSCTVTEILKFEATVTTAKYTFNADGTANLNNTIVIKVPIAGCNITVKPQNTLKTLTYKNTGKNVIVEPNVSGIVSEGSGGECGTGVTNKGTYTGTTEVTSSGNTISWE